MRIFYIDNVKRFMNALFKSSLFDNYEARGIVLQTFTRFEIDCVSGGKAGEQDSVKTKYCLWSEIKPVLLELVKGVRPPSLLKVKLSLSGLSAEEIDTNAAALHITITYENGAISVLTGSSQKKFSLDKSVDGMWDSHVIRVFGESRFEIREAE